VFDAPSDDDGYVSPEFDLPDLPSDDEDMAPPPSKRNKSDSHSNKRTTKALSDAGLDDEEELALRLLGRG
jgi:ATP-dependent RNA helicase DDX10/DBP4